MHIASVNHAAASAKAARTPEAAEAPGVPDHDGDGDDRAVQAQAAPVSPTVNGAGQALGQVVNVKA